MASLPLKILPSHWHEVELVSVACLMDLDGYRSLQYCLFKMMDEVLNDGQVLDQEILMIFSI